jgi:hypothetical protein
LVVVGVSHYAAEMVVVLLFITKGTMDVDRARRSTARLCWQRLLSLGRREKV